MGVKKEAASERELFTASTLRKVGGGASQTNVLSGFPVFCDLDGLTFGTKSFGLASLGYFKAFRKPCSQVCCFPSAVALAGDFDGQHTLKPQPCTAGNHWNSQRWIMLLPLDNRSLNKYTSKHFCRDCTGKRVLPIQTCKHSRPSCILHL